MTTDGFSQENAQIIALAMTAVIEGAMQLCLTQKLGEPLKIILKELPNLVKEVVN